MTESVEFSMTKLILIRHGESLGNAVRRLLGHTDLDLSPLGYRQAEATAEALKDEKIDAIYSSDLLRAYNTAVPHALRRGLCVNPSLALREIRLGEWEGKSVDEVVAEYGDMYEKDWVCGYGTFKFPGGESTIEAGQRFFAECKRIAEENRDRTVLITAHAAVIRSFYSIVMQIPPEEIAARLPFPSNASFSEVFYDNGEFFAGRFSVDDHLRSVGVTKL